MRVNVPFRIFFVSTLLNLGTFRMNQCDEYYELGPVIKHRLCLLNAIDRRQVVDTFMTEYDALIRTDFCPDHPSEVIAGLCGDEGQKC
jgi:hypothetical protein